MAREASIFGGPYGDRYAKVGKVEITRRGKIVVIPRNPYGRHTTYMPSGEIHHTDPSRPPGERYVLRDPRGPALADVSLYTFESLIVPSTGPPPHARIVECPRGGPAFQPPEQGIGRVWVAAAGRDYVEEAREYITEITSGSTQLLGYYESIAYVLVWDPTDALSGTTFLPGLDDL